MYLSGRIGYSNIQLADYSPLLTQSSHFALGIGGGYNFNPSRNALIGLELNINYLGQINSVSNIVSYEYLLTGHYVKDYFDVFLKTGVAIERLSNNINGIQAYSDATPLVAGGLGYVLPKNPKLEPFFEISHIFAGSGLNGAFGNTAVFIGLTYHFRAMKNPGITPSHQRS